MSSITNRNLDYTRPVKLADDVYWVGFTDVSSGLHCNPYLIIDKGEGVLIDGGSRPDFSSVMMKIMETGIEPRSISTLIYQHYDPDLCGSIPNLEDIIGRPDLAILSHRENNIFIRYYAAKAQLGCVELLGFKITLGSGRTLRFIRTPYSHSAGSFVTFDEKSGILFSSDLFGSYDMGADWELFAEVGEKCRNCTDKKIYGQERFVCDKVKKRCIYPGVFNFHRRVMPSNKALRHAVKTVLGAAASMVAPQHGSVFHNGEDIAAVGHKLLTLDDIGIDGIPEAG